MPVFILLLVAVVIALVVLIYKMNNDKDNHMN